MNENLFVDTETTGLPASRKLNWETDYMQFPRIVSMSWINDESKGPYFIINQEGEPIPAEATAIHGITDEMAAQSDITFGTVAEHFIQAALEAKIIVGHNIYFDSSIFKANVLRVFGPGSKQAAAAILALDKTKRRDTIRMAQKFMGGWKSLGTLYFALFGKSYEGHHAFSDVKALKECYEALIQRGIWVPYVTAPVAPEAAISLDKALKDLHNEEI